MRVCQFTPSTFVLCSVLLFPVMENQSLSIWGRIRATAGFESTFWFGAGLGLSSRLESDLSSGSGWGWTTKQLEVSLTERARRTFCRDLCPF